MANTTRTTVWVDGNTLTAAALNGEFNNLLNSLQLMNADIASSAAISLTKLAGSDEGGIPYDNGSSISVLAPGTSGQVLQTQGAGQAPIWGTVSPNSGVAVDSTEQILSGTLTQIGALTVTLTTTGKPVLVVGQVGAFDDGITTPTAAIFNLYLDGSQVLNNWGYVWSTGVRRTMVPFAYMATPAAGSHTWLIKGQTGGGSIVSEGSSQGPNYLAVYEL